jgi:hypothetical protein
MMRFSFLLVFLLAGRAFAAASGGAYYIDSRFGDDGNAGTAAGSAWKSLARVERVRLLPGDSVLFRRGSLFEGRLVIADSGRQGKPIVLTDYDSPSEAAPLFTNPVFGDGTYGNCIRVRGAWVVVENLGFYGTAAYSPVEYHGDGWVVWEMGAIHLERGAEHCVVRNNEMRDCVAGIRSNGAYALIEGNYIHDCNRVLKEWNWGPLGIWMGADHQEVCHNRIYNYSAVDPRIGWGPDAYGGGADGGALEIDDARYDKSDISIHDNETRDNQGFLEVTWTDVKKNPGYRGFRVYQNVSDDFQQFVALWRGADCRIENNVIYRRKVNANEWGVFNITQNHSHNIVRGNTIVTGKGVEVFKVGRKGTAVPETVIVGNRYSCDGDSVRMGKEGPGDSAVYGGFRFSIARDGKALAGVGLGSGVGAAGKFATAELGKYLFAMTGVRIGNGKGRPVIRLERTDSLGVDGYIIDLRGRDLVLAGGSDRALLYAVYDLLHRLGCVWAAPILSGFQGEHVPSVRALTYVAAGAVREAPVMKYRKLDVEEGRTHTVANLKQLIDWMPKVRLNVLQVPLNYQGAGRVRWDNWRDSLTPELKRRGLLIEVGGHGYQNFLGARMEGGALFRQHPEWFGENAQGQPDTTMRVVFNTSNPDAVKYFLGNIERYLREHPEIDIFDCWPPDVARWALSPAMAALGTAVDRQARLMNQVDSLVKRIRPGLKVEIIAYGQVLDPPSRLSLHKDILVDFCPIDQSFERPLFDTSMVANVAYFQAAENWRRFAGDRALYSYYRKYVWRSLPVMLPHFMQEELRWYARIGVRGVSSYAEPGDWFTYGMNHYVLAGLAWNPDAPVDMLMDEYVGVVYGAAARGVALGAYRELERIVRNFGSIPFTRLKPAGSVDSAVGVLSRWRGNVDSAAVVAGNGDFAANLRRLGLMLDYAIGDLEIVKLKVAGAPVEGRVKQLVEMLERHRGEGIFVLRDSDNLGPLLNHYNSLK